MPLKAAFKSRGTKISEDRLLELLHTIEKHCSWFPSFLFRFMNTGEGR